jgi:epoxyqueuosine reductase
LVADEANATEGSMSAAGADGEAGGGPQAVPSTATAEPDDRASLPAVSSAQIAGWARELGFGSAGIAGIDLAQAEPGLQEWLAAGCHGEMDYMARHGLRRARPAELVPGTLSVVMATMDYAPARLGLAGAGLADPGRRRARLRLALRAGPRLSQGRSGPARAAGTAPGGGGRSAGVSGLLRLGAGTRSGARRTRGSGLARQAHLLLNRTQGSSFFLGTLYTSLPLAPDPPASDHCGSCVRCLQACPTGAITAPYRLDARRCISYLTIELAGSIPVPLRAAIGNRIYGCDDCQLVCPWNRYARASSVPDFAPRHALDSASLADLFAWTAEQFDARMAGSAIRRIGHERWLRNIAVALGNVGASGRVAALAALQTRRDDPSALVREHVRWAIGRLHGDPSDGARGGACEPSGDEGRTGGSCDGGRADGPS